jgi:hypothetical protein
MYKKGLDNAYKVLVGKPERKRDHLVDHFIDGVLY